jgi:hypothetical protein
VHDVLAGWRHGLAARPAASNGSAPARPLVTAARDR